MTSTPEPQPWLELRIIREKDGHTLTSLALAAVDENGKPMSLGYLSDLESGKRNPSARVRKRLAVALNVPVSMLEKRRHEVAA